MNAAHMSVHGTDASSRHLDGDARGIDYSNPVQEEMNRARIVAEERGGTSVAEGRLAFDALKSAPGYRDRIQRVALDDTYNNYRKTEALAR